MVRRTKDVIRGSLPSALEVVVFCRPSPQQQSLYEACVATSGARALLVDVLGEELTPDEGGQEDGVDATRHLPVGLRGVLPLISSLRRLCNHPDLVAGRGSREGAGSGGGGSIGGNDGGGGVCDKISDDCAGTLREELDDGDDGGDSVDSDDGDDNDDGDDSDDVRPSDDEAATEKARPLLAKKKENIVDVAAAAAAAAGGGAAMTSHAHGKGNSLADSGGRGPTRAWKVPRVVSGAAKARAPVVAARVETGRQKKTNLAAASSELPNYETEASGKVVVLEALLRTVRRAYPGDKVRTLRKNAKNSALPSEEGRGRNFKAVVPGSVSCARCCFLRLRQLRPACFVVTLALIHI